MSYKFGPALKPRTKIRPYMSVTDPKAFISSSAIYIPEVCYKEAGNPAMLLISVDDDRKAFKIEASPNGYKVTEDVTTNGQKYYSFLQNLSRLHSGPAGELPKGIYKPIGGGIFEYDKTAN